MRFENRTVFCVRVGEPASAPVELHAECAEALLIERALGLGQRDLLRLRVPALGEIPHALLAAPADDRHLPACVQDAEHQAHLARAPPAVRFASRRLVILDLAGEKRPALLQLAQDVTPERGVLLQVLDEPPVVRPVVSPHASLEERQVLGGPEERVPFDELALLPEQPVELGPIEGAEPAPEHEVLRRCDGRDGIEL